MSADERAAVAEAEAALPRDKDVGAAAAAVLQAAKDRVLTTVDLAAAEVRLAAMSGLTMLLFAIVAGAALVIAWLLLVTLAVYGAALAGIAWPIAAVALLAVHAAIAYFLWRATVRLSRNLTLPQLRGAFGPPAASLGTDSYVPARSATGARRG